jgi:hypothetical protein
MAKRLRCYLGFHSWQRIVTDDGGAYRRCKDCGKSRLPPDVGPPFLGGGGFSP